MKRSLIIAMAIGCTFASCKKKTSVTPATAKATRDIVAPAGFTWENSRNVTFVVNVTDARFPSARHIISIYDGDPATGGKLVLKGAATGAAAFRSKTYLSKQITGVFIVSTAPDNTSVKKTVPANTREVTVTVAN